MACLCLYNYLWHTENSLYIPQGFADIELVDGKIKEENGGHRSGKPVA